MTNWISCTTRQQPNNGGLLWATWISSELLKVFVTWCYLHYLHYACIFLKIGAWPGGFDVEALATRQLAWVFWLNFSWECKEEQKLINTFLIQFWNFSWECKEEHMLSCYLLPTIKKGKLKNQEQSLDLCYVFIAKC